MKREPLLTLLVVSNVVKGLCPDWIQELVEQCEATQNVELLVVMDNGCRQHIRQEALSLVKGKLVAFLDEGMACDVDAILGKLYINPCASHVPEMVGIELFPRHLVDLGGHC